MRPEAIFFRNNEELRAWFAENHDKLSSVQIGYYKKATGKESIDWSGSVDVAICFGWIDGIRHKIDEERYTIRFTPRKPTSHWSKVNIDKVARLMAAGLMEEPGIEAWNRRTENNSSQFSYEQENLQMAPEYVKQIQADPNAWDFYCSLAPSYKKSTIHWVMSAKKEETRQKRLGILIESSKAGLKIPPIRKPGKK